ncbi:MAG TPA: tetratricopeptide repeat protein [Nitrososphaeraceae archaeon]
MTTVLPQYYDKVLAIDSNNIRALYNKAYALHNMGKLEEERECLTKTLPINPTDIRSMTIKGLSLYALGKYQEAIEYYDKVLAVDSNNMITTEL